MSDFKHAVWRVIISQENDLGLYYCNIEVSYTQSEAIKKGLKEVSEWLKVPITKLKFVGIKKSISQVSDNTPTPKRA